MLKNGKPAVIAVLALLVITQLIFIKNDKTTDKPVNNLATNYGEYVTEDYDEPSSEEIKVTSELNVVYKSTATYHDDSFEGETFSEKSNGTVVSYTLSELPIYEQADSKSAVVGIMYSGSEGTIVERGTEWTKITSGDVTGYVHNVDVLFDDEATVIASMIGDKQAKINADINVYVSPDENSTVISELANGAEVDAYEESGEYTLITCDNGYGYVKTACITTSFGLEKAKSMAEIEAIAEAERAAAAEAAAKAAAEQAAAAQAAAQAAAIKQGVTTRGTYNATEEEIHLLTAIIYWESGWEPADGQLAVANVVLNRVLSPRFSQNSIASVIYAPGQFYGVAENGGPSARFQSVLAMSNADLNVRGCYDAALRALAGENNIGDLLFFINVKKANFAKYTGYTIINNHCFYIY